MAQALFALIPLFVNLLSFLVHAKIRPYNSLDIATEPSYHSWKEIAEWDYLLFVQRWPPSVCADEDDQTLQHIHPAKRNSRKLPRDGVKCAIPPVVSRNTWVMHGVWPTKNGTEGPVNCQKNATFIIKPLDPILDDLRAFWPNLEADTAEDSFWKHEWLKHGTCAQSLPSLSGEYNYFNMALHIRNSKYNLYQALADKGIVPSTTKHSSHADFVQALKETYGKSVQVWCAYSKATKLHYITEIRICLTKDFQMMDCPFSPSNLSYSQTSPCPKRIPLQYAPSNDTRTFIE
ncbi:hypothetical protein RvY_11061 [Ramazzottius varieornatus]|uniref:Uncharacterized protein n=1 Tax=Ramazzottius varieornatus TaxID=947166 RepID=A0A1D1VMN7_RAMVA|nr:hypothetical protein RvY_11061 [Ramazzottius varieornatus]